MNYQMILILVLPKKVTAISIKNGYLTLKACATVHRYRIAYRGTAGSCRSFRKGECRREFRNDNTGDDGYSEE